MHNSLKIKKNRHLQFDKLKKWARVNHRRYNKPSARCCTLMRATPGNSTDWEMKGLTTALPRAT